MSYDLSLCDPVSGEELQVPAHCMYGTNVPCELVNGQLVPTTRTDASISITYNYSGYFYEVLPTTNPSEADYGEQVANAIAKRGWIFTLNGMSGAEAVPVLRKAIRDIESRYRDETGKWKDTTRTELVVFKKATCERCDSTAKLDLYFKLRKRGLSDAEIRHEIDNTFETREETVVVNEGGGEADYWLATAANAIRALYKVLALSLMRPDGIWKVR